MECARFMLSSEGATAITATILLKGTNAEIGKPTWGICQFVQSRNGLNLALSDITMVCQTGGGFVIRNVSMLFRSKASSSFQKVSSESREGLDLTTTNHAI